MTSQEFQVLFKTDAKEPQWCPGCGDFGGLKVIVTAFSELAAEDRQIHAALALEEVLGMREAGLDAKLCRLCPEARELGPHYFPRWEPHTIVTDAGIGCSGQVLSYWNTFGLKMTHGRVIPAGVALKLARPDITVVGGSGDGDTLAIGAGHFVNEGRYNADITHFIDNNEVYGLTKGQNSPSSPLGLKTAVNPEGPVAEPVNAIGLALVSGWTFIARLVIAGKLKDGTDSFRHAVDVAKQGIRHRGSSFIAFETPCPTYNKVKTPGWLSERACAIETLEPNYDVTSQTAAFALSLIPENEKIPVGIYYWDKKKLTLNDRLGIRRPLINVELPDEEFEKLLDRFA